MDVHILQQLVVLTTVRQSDSACGCLVVSPTEMRYGETVVVRLCCHIAHEHLGVLLLGVRESRLLLAPSKLTAFPTLFFVGAASPAERLLTAVIFWH